MFMGKVSSGHPVGGLDKHQLMLKNIGLLLEDPDVKFDVS